jgi:uncharacterized protein (DUF1697 family)
MTKTVAPGRGAIPADRFAALLRGINVGRAKRVAMADLRALIEKLGYLEVRTLLNSGNVVFGAPARVRGDHARRIEEGIAGTLGFSSRVTVLSAAEVSRVIRENGLLDLATNPSLLLVFTVAEAEDRRALQAIVRADWGKEAAALGKHALYAWCPGGQIESPLAIAVNRALGDRTTARNWATFQKLAALLSGGT